MPPNALRKNRDFIILVGGRTVSEFGTAMTTFVIPWLFLQITGSGVQTGIAFALGFIPYIVLSLPAGVWADRFSRKGLIIASDFGRLVLLLSIPSIHLITGFTPLYLLYTVQAGVSGFSAIFDASYGACLPNFVRREQFQDANNVLQTGRSLSKIAGPMLGGIVLFWIGSANTILIDIASYIVSIISVLAITKSFPGPGSRNTSSTFIEDVREGITTLWNIKPVRYLMLFATLVNLVGPGMDVALLYRIQHELVLPSQWAGIIMTGLSVGMFLGSLGTRWVSRRINMTYWLTISSILQIAPPIVLSITPNPFVMCLTQVFIGLLLVVWNVQSVTLRQLLIPDHLLGRCSSAFRLSAWVSIPLGDGLAGILGQHFGTQTYFIFAACVLVIVAVLTVSVRLHQVILSADSAVSS